jgi:hypothetical protein
MKKTKCDGEFPCKRCRDDGLVCTAGIRKKVDYKQLPRGYAEVLENTQLALIATVHKLYAMVRNGEPWVLEEPELNERGQPVIHHIAQKLGCIRPNSDIDLPVHSAFPENEEAMAGLVRQLEEQQAKEGLQQDLSHGLSVAMKRSITGDDFLDSTGSSSHGTSSEPSAMDMYNVGRVDRASSSDLDHSDLEGDYRKFVFRGSNGMEGGGGGMMLSPRSFSSAPEFDFGSNSLASVDATRTMFSSAQSPISPSFAGWSPSMPQQQDVMQPQGGPQAQVQQHPQQQRPQHQHKQNQQQMLLLQQQQQQQQQQRQQQQQQQRQGQAPPLLTRTTMPFLSPQNDLMQNFDMLNEGLMESEFGTIKPHIISCPNPEAMMGMGDPMIYSGGSQFGDNDQLI